MGAEPAMMALTGRSRRRASGALNSPICNNRTKLACRGPNACALHERLREAEAKTHLDRGRAAVVRHAGIDEVVPDERVGHRADRNLREHSKVLHYVKHARNNGEQKRDGPVQQLQR